MENGRYFKYSEPIVGTTRLEMPAFRGMGKSLARKIFNRVKYLPKSPLESSISIDWD
jgi:hypothetical protein